MPKEGMERKAYRLQKFGSIEYSDTLDAQVIQAGKTCNIDFKFNDRTPNTRAGHLLIKYANEQSERKCNQNDLMEALFEAYFCSNKDIGNLEVLAEIGSAQGLDKTDLLDYLAKEESQQELDAEISLATKLKISSVPSFVINSKLAFSGAQSPSTIKDILSTALLST